MGHARAGDRLAHNLAQLACKFTCPSSSRLQQLASRRPPGARAHEHSSSWGCNHCVHCQRAAASGKRLVARLVLPGRLMAPLVIAVVGYTGGVGTCLLAAMERVGIKPFALVRSSTMQCGDGAAEPVDFVALGKRRIAAASEI